MSRSGHTDGAEDLAGLARRVNDLVAENTRLIDEFRHMQRHFGGLARSVWRVQEDERRRLARELHDGVGQNLTALRHRLERMGSGGQRDAALELVDQVLEDVRELSRLLRPPVLDDLGLAAAVRWLCRRIRESVGLPVKAEVDALEGLDPDDDTETLIFRVVQEALNNCIRHAGASRAAVSATRSGNRLEVVISDNGRGFDPARIREHPETAGIGLAGMSDRASLFGGDLTISSRPGRGTRIVLGIPLRPSNRTGGDMP